MAARLDELESLLSPDLYKRVWRAMRDEPEVHESCGAFRERVIEITALHFGPLAPAFRAVANHVRDYHDGVLDTFGCGVEATHMPAIETRS